MTKSTAADTKNKSQKRAKKNSGGEEESKQAVQPKKKRTARNRTNPNVMAMCQQLDLDISNMDPNDEELRAVLLAACEGSDEEANSPKGKKQDEEESQF